MWSVCVCAWCTNIRWILNEFTARILVLLTNIMANMKTKKNELKRIKMIILSEITLNLYEHNLFIPIFKMRIHPKIKHCICWIYPQCTGFISGSPFLQVGGRWTGSCPVSRVWKRRWSSSWAKLKARINTARATVNTSLHRMWMKNLSIH